MKNKLIFRILGALASALIIVSVFIPFINVTGYTTSLWESFEVADSLYLPIMIIVFGAIGVIFFALNIKTEFAYMSTGAIAFFIIMETIDILNQGVFNTLSVGYYCLAVGALLTGIMAFLTNLKFKKKEEQPVSIMPSTEPSMLEQMDKLYNESTTVQNEISPMQSVNIVIEPLPVQPLQSSAPIQPVNPVVQEQPIAEVPVNPIVQEIPVVKENQPVVAAQNVSVEQPINPVLQEFAQPVNPVVQEFAQPVNPVVQEFSVPQENIQPVVEQSQPVSQSEPTNEPTQFNPVVQEFTNPSTPTSSQINLAGNELDIFGQPINK